MQQLCVTCQFPVFLLPLEGSMTKRGNSNQLCLGSAECIPMLVQIFGQDSLSGCFPEASPFTLLVVFLGIFCEIVLRFPSRYTSRPQYIHIQKVGCLLHACRSKLKRITHILFDLMICRACMPICCIFFFVI